ncbi:MAG: four helix bundle protein [Alphaproteobacteria bacterium]|nr:four helix bundle protein [Alphaproteobacteria bacterium]MCB9699738.1 four helix bundle protein [Alphaproteobacteria bacterium]
MGEPGRQLQFAHHRLDVYAVALELVVVTRKLTERVPRGHRSIADQGLRASASVVLLIAEGAHRRTAGDKRHRYSMARGECGEVAAVIEVMMALGFVDDSRAHEALALANRASAMLLRLEQRFAPDP